MVNKLRNILRIIWRKIYKSTTSLIPRLSFDELTRLSWAKPIESYDEVPGVFQEFFEPFLANEQRFPYTVLTPSFEGFIQPITEKLVCDRGEAICVLEKLGDTFQAYCYPPEGISHIVTRTVLLDSRIDISGVTLQGVLNCSSLRFNSVTDYLFKPILKRLRLPSADARNIAEVSEGDKFDHWMNVNYKFMNYARHSLLGGETVIQTILLPEFRKSRLTLLGKSFFYQTIVPTQAIVLTDRELILIQEEVSKNDPTKYGGTRYFIPVKKIAASSWQAKEDDLVVLSIDTIDGDHLEFMFHASAQAQINRLLEWRE